LIDEIPFQAIIVRLKPLKSAIQMDRPQGAALFRPVASLPLYCNYSMRSDSFVPGRNRLTERHRDHEDRIETGSMLLP
jgi:hypothetical protein